MQIQLEKIHKTFEANPILHNISLEIVSGEMLALLGPSGSGKTTLLRIIAGLEQQNSGQIYFDHEDVSSVQAQVRRVGFVFQHYALFRHMTVFENVAFGLSVLPRNQRPSKSAIHQQVMRLLDMVQLSHLANRRPHQLSGGQKQRIALARALAVKPPILLLDEPFSALDVQVRKELRQSFQRLHQELKFTAIFVTHDQQEAMEIADRIAIMHQGMIEQLGTPRQIWQQPKNRFVLEFMGKANQLSGQIMDNQLIIGQYHFMLSKVNTHQGPIDVFLAPWQLHLSAQADANHCIACTILNITPHYNDWKITLQIEIEESNSILELLYQQEFCPVEQGQRSYLSFSHPRFYHKDVELTDIQLINTQAQLNDISILKKVCAGG